MEAYREKINLIIMGVIMNASEEIVCIATFVAKDGKADILHAALNSLIEPTKKEEECLCYELYQSLDNPCTFIMIEKYENKAAFDFHINQPYLVDFKNSRHELCESVSAKFYK